MYIYMCVCACVLLLWDAEVEVEGLEYLSVDWIMTSSEESRRWACPMSGEELGCSTICRQSHGYTWGDLNDPVGLQAVII